MFERFTRDAREIVERAQAEVRALAAERIGAEHLLLGVATGSGRAAQVLADHGATARALRARLRAVGDEAALAAIGIDLGELRRRAEAQFGPGALDRGRRDCRHTPFTPQAKKALELSLREAIAAGDKRIGPEHVLLGLLCDDDVQALLQRVGAPPALLRDEISLAGSRRGRGA
jgi:ATP-dependent Clp protease ATP-binding subunit ClpA